MSATVHFSTLITADCLCRKDTHKILAKLEWQRLKYLTCTTDNTCIWLENTKTLSDMFLKLSYENSTSFNMRSSKCMHLIDLLVSILMCSFESLFPRACFLHKGRLWAFSFCNIPIILKRLSCSYNTSVHTGLHI